MGICTDIFHSSGISFVVHVLFDDVMNRLRPFWNVCFNNSFLTLYISDVLRGLIMLGCLRFHLVEEVCLGGKKSSSSIDSIEGLVMSIEMSQGEFMVIC
jgi:hypothetical protein